MQESHVMGRTGVKALLILNPVADSGAAMHAWDAAMPLLETYGIEIQRTVSERKGHAVELASGHTRDDYDVVVAVGGDGTIFEVVNGLMSTPREQRPALAVVPAGRCADFCSTMRIPRDVKEATRLIASGNLRTIDVGELHYQGEEGREQAYFVNIAGLGLEGETSETIDATPVWLSRIIGSRGVYEGSTRLTFLRYRDKDLALTVDGVVYRALATTVAVANGKYYGCDMKIAPGADPADGLFDVVVAGPGNSTPFIQTPEGEPAPRGWVGHRVASRLRLLSNLKYVYSGAHIDLASVGLLHGTEVAVESPDRMVLQAEGEVLGTAPCTVRLLPRELEVVAPVG